MSDRSAAARVPQSPWHWATAAAGLVLLVATIAFLVHDGVVRRRTPHPVLHVAADSVAETPAGHVVRVRVRNDGGGAVASLLVEGTLHAGDTLVERAETSLDYVPPLSTREAGLVFARDPRALRLEVRARGFDVP